MRRLFVYIGIGMMLVGLASCHEDIDIFEPAELTSGDIARFFEAVQSNPLQIQWDASEEKIIGLPGSGQAIVPSNALAMQDGSPVSGMVQANIIEIHNKGSIIRNNTPTAASSRLLESASILYLQVEQDGQPLRLVNGKTIKVQLSTANYNPQFRLFTGAELGDNTLEWTEVDAGESPVRAIEFFNEQAGRWEEGFEITTAHMGWLQCAKYADSTPGEATACVRLPLGFQPKNTVAFLAMQNINAVVKLDEVSEEGIHKICKSGLPTGHKGEFIIIAEGDEGAYYFARQPVIVTGQLSINIVPERVTLSDIILALEGL